MAEILIIWLYIFATSFTVGDAFLGLVNKKLSLEEATKHPIISSFAGLTIITVFTGYISIFSPVNIYSHIPLIVFSLVYLFLKRKATCDFTGLRKDKLKFLSLAFLVIAIIFFLSKTAGVITNPDSGGYHIPIIKWIEQYKVVKGTANLHRRFGFNYQYSLLCALYGLNFLKGITFHAMNGYIMAGLIVYLVTTLNIFNNRNFSIRDSIHIIILFFVIQMNDAVSSFSPDFPVAAFLILSFSLLTHQSVQQNLYKFDNNSVSILLLITGSILFKISSAPAFLFILLFTARKIRQHKQQVLFVLLFSTIAFTPYLIRNYYISGYLIFPFYNLDIFSVAWKVPKDVVIFTKNDVHDYYNFNAADIGHKPLIPMLHIWLKTLGSYNVTNIYMICLLSVTIVANFLFCLKVLIINKTKEYRSLLALFLITYICLIYWFFNAPDPRFGNGFILPFIAMTWASVFQYIIKKRSRLFIGSALALLILYSCLQLSGFTLSKKSFSTATLYKNQQIKGVYLLHQAPYPIPDTTSGYISGNRIYIVPSDKGCWCTEQPCTFENEHGKFTLIGKKIQEGFKPIYTKSP